MNKSTVYLPPELQRRMEQYARRAGVSQAAIIRAALNQYLGQQERPKLRSVGIGENREVHGRDSEEWLRQHWAQE
jgi:predicted transcriptional regulator